MMEATEINVLQSQLDEAKERLKSVEDTIKKSTGRDLVPSNFGSVSRPFKRSARIVSEEPEKDGPPPRKRQSNLSDGIRSRLGGIDQRSREPDLRTGLSRSFRSQEAKKELPLRGRLDDAPIPAKKRLGAVTLFSRLSGPPKDDEYEEKEVKLTSQVIVQDAPSKKEILAAQNGDRGLKERNKRMFGALLNTLQRFKQEENQLKDKEEKRAKVEKKLEEAAAKEKEEAKKLRQQLFSTRRQQQEEIRQLEFKLNRLKQFRDWEATKIPLKNYIQTKARPRIYYIPKIHNEKSQQLLLESQQEVEREIEERKALLESEIPLDQEKALEGKKQQIKMEMEEEDGGEDTLDESGIQEVSKDICIKADEYEEEEEGDYPGYPQVKEDQDEPMAEDDGPKEEPDDPPANGGSPPPLPPSPAPQ